MGLIYFFMYCTFGLGFWFGSWLIENEIHNHGKNATYTVGDILTVYFAVVFSSFSLGQASPCFKFFTLG